MSKKEKLAQVAEVKTPEDALKLVPPQFRGLASQYVELPQRVAKLEETVNRLLEVIQKGMEKAEAMKSETMKAMGPMQSGVSSVPGAGVSQFLPLLTSMFGGGGSPFERLAMRMAVESMAFSSIFQKSLLRAMGKGLSKAYGEKVTEMMKEMGVPEKEVESEVERSE